MNKLNLTTNFHSSDKEKRQRAIDCAVAKIGTILEENNIDKESIYVGNIDFMPHDILDNFTHCAFLAGLTEKLVIQDLNTYENIVDYREVV